MGTTRAALAPALVVVVAVAVLGAGGEYCGTGIGTGHQPIGIGGGGGMLFMKAAMSADQEGCVHDIDAWLGGHDISGC